MTSLKPADLGGPHCFQSIFLVRVYNIFSVLVHIDYIDGGENISFPNSGVTF